MNIKKYFNRLTFRDLILFSLFTFIGYCQYTFSWLDGVKSNYVLSMRIFFFIIYTLFMILAFAENNRLDKLEVKKC